MNHAKLIPSKKKAYFIISNFCLVCQFVFSCQIDVNPTEKNNSDQIIIAEANLWFNKVNSNVRNSRNTSDNWGEKTPSWDKAKTYKIGNADVIEIPLTYTKNLGFNMNGNEKKKEDSFAGMTKLLIFKSKNVFSMQIMKLIVDNDYLHKIKNDLTKNTYRVRGNSFSGFELFYNWDETFLFGYHYENGIWKGKVTVKDFKSLKSGRIAKPLCTEWHLITYETHTGTVVSDITVARTGCDDGGGTDGTTGSGGSGDGRVNFGADFTICETLFFGANPHLIIPAQLNRTEANEITDNIACDGQGFQDNVNTNAFKHAYWSAINTLSFGSDIARQIGNNHECGNVTPGQRMDLHNNGLGILIAANNPNVNSETIRALIIQAIKSGQGRILNGTSLSVSSSFNICE